MKRKRFLRLMGVGVVLTMLLSVFIASPVFAASITIDPREGRIGDEVEVSGIDFDPLVVEPPVEYRYVDVYFTAATTTGAAPSTSSDIGEEVTAYELMESGVQADIDGEFTVSFDVPDELTDGSGSDVTVRGGVYYVAVTFEDDERIRARAPYTVIAGEITDFSPDNGPVGTEVAIAGENFAESENLTVKFDDSDITDEIASGDPDTSNNGDIDISIIIPPAAAGEHTITVADESLSEATETFTVESSMSVSPITGPPGATATASGTGFGDRKEVDVTLNGASVVTATTSRDGSFSIAFTVPDIAEGIYDLVAIDGDDNQAETQFTVEIGTQIAITPETTAAAPGNVGQSITISGVAFKPNAEVTITYTSDPVVVGTTPTDANGDFSFTFKVPKSPAGAHTISASDGTSSLQMPFYMESDAPPVPQPLLPEIGTKAPSLAEFDWGDVSDDSGVTYTLQIATTQDFSANSIVLEKDSLATSGYTLSKEESLPSRSAKEPYYWRVMAADGAGNKSDWTGANDFSVGVSLPPWTVHLFWGLGVIGAVFFGYFLGKRRGYY